MQQIFFQLSVLVVLTGVSLATVQYIFTNHQKHLKDFIASLKSVEFDKDNEYDLKLERQWENAINSCKRHTYLINPNYSILFGLIIIFFLVFTYLLTYLPYIFIVDFIKWMVFGTGVALFVWLILVFFTLIQIDKKQKSIKLEFDEIEKRHQLAEKILSSNNS